MGELRSGSENCERKFTVSKAEMSVILSYQPRNPFYYLLLLANKDEFNHISLNPPKFSAHNPHLLSCEEETKLFFHKEKSIWFGLTKTGRIALMVDVRVGQQMNNEFQKRHVELDGSTSNSNNEVKKEDKNDTTSSDSKPSESKSERIRQLKQDARKLMVRDYLLNEEIQPMQYISKIASKSTKLDPFNLLLGSLQDGLYFFSNRDPNRCAYELMHGEYTIDDTPGIDNSLLTLSMKMINGKRKFVDLLTTLKLSKTASFSLPDTETSDDMNPVDDVNVQTVLSKKERYLRIQRRFYDSDTICELFNILENEQKHQMQPESQLPELYRGLSKEYEDFLSSIFVSSHIYSTKASYILLIQPGDRTRALINGNQLTFLNNTNTDDLYASTEPPKSPGVASASSGSRPSSARSYGGRPGSAGTTSKQVSGKLVMKKREYRVTLVHRTYNHNLMHEEEKSAAAATCITPLELPEMNDEQEDDAPTTDDNRYDIAQFIEISKRRKIYTTQFQFFNIVKQTVDPLEETNLLDPDSDLDDMDPDLELISTQPQSTQPTIIEPTSELGNKRKPPKLVKQSSKTSVTT